jgi:hypothetical protein
MTYKYCDDRAVFLSATLLQVKRMITSNDEALTPEERLIYNKNIIRLEAGAI